MLPLRFTRVVSCLATALAGLVVAHAEAQSTVDLRLVGPTTPIIPGQTFDVKLRAERQNPALAASFVAIDAIIGWDPTKVRFLSISTTGSVPLASSYLPSPAVDYTGINEAAVPADGNLLYYGLAPLGQTRAVPVGGVQIVTFRFQSIAHFTLSQVDVIDNLNISTPTETAVWDGTKAGLDVFGLGFGAAINQLDCSTIFWYRDSDGDGAGDPSDSTTGCTQPAGYVSSSNDLCPTNAALLAPITYYADADADGFGASGASGAFCSTTAPSGYVTDATDCNDALVTYADGDGDGFGAGPRTNCGVATNTDCNDQASAINPGATEICDAANTDEDCDTLADNADSSAADAGKTNFFVDGDSDTYGAGAAVRFCDMPSGYSAVSTDCNDIRADVNPGATEVCDAANTDEDCDTLADNADSSAADAGKTNFFVDGDSDTYGAGAAVRFCDMPSGYSAVSTDCDDVRADVNPGATEVCDAANTDEDCDTLADNADSSAADAGKTNFFVDGDSDTYGAGAAVRFCDMPSGYSAVSTDCDDVRADVNPGAIEVCDLANTDEDCDALADNADSSAADAGKTNFFVDGDSDTYGAGSAVRFCDMPSGYSAVSTDCDDVRADVNPGATEVCDAANTDEDCDTLADNADSSAADAGKTNFFVDGDSDTYGAGSAARFCDMPSGYSAVSTDCDDVRADVNPGATEVCDAANTDEDCDTLADNADSSAADAGKTNFFVDGDSDTYGAGSAVRFCDMPSGYSAVSTDCDDVRADVNPGATEVCDAANTDEDCDTLADNADSSAADAGKTNFFVDGDSDTYGAGAAVRFCDMPSGYSAVSTDCDDVRADVNPGATEVCDLANTDEDCDTLADNADSSAADAGKTNFFVDGDSDTYGAGSAVRFCDMPSGYSAVSTDCDDVRADVNPGATEVCDAANTDEDCDTLADNADSSAADAGKTDFFVDGDSDTYGAGSAVRFCDMPSGYSAVSTDCDDVRADVNPGATEVCDAANTDEDCDTLADNADSSAADAGKTDFFVDGDSDTYGAGAAARFCDMPSGYSAVSTDCDDVRADVNPGATEVCDLANTDEDCDTLADNADSSADDAGKTDFFVDGDSDTYGAGAAVRFCDMPSGYSAVSTDCDDVRADVNPGATEVCDLANTDEDCDTLADNADSSAADAGKTDFFVDGDSDTYGAGAAARFCDMPSGYSAVSTDCDDVRADVNPGATEVCDLANTDEDCDTLADNADSSAADAGKTNFFVDGDSDTYGAGSAVRFCDMPSGYSAVSTDCDDVRADVNPGATEVCDASNTDEDCDTLADNADSSAADAGKTNFFVDGDSDTYGAGAAVRFCDMPSGYSLVSTDCDDIRADVNPGAIEVCDAANTDEDCDTLADNADSSAADAGKTDFFVDGDSDTYGAGSAVRFCDMPSGYSAVSTDCDDVRADVNPAGQEVCDAGNTDEDCDTLADDADGSVADAGRSSFYSDADNDNYGVRPAQRFCDEPALYAPVAGDCDDTRADVNPAAQEICDAANTDENCNSVADNLDRTAADAGKTDFYVDSDADTYGAGSAARFCDMPSGYSAVSTDCNDIRADVNPGATEVCDAANTDEDCDTLADNADASAADAGKTNFFVDGDSDTYGAGAAVRFCDMPSGYSAVSTDCDDVRADVNPGAAEICDAANTDEDCDTLADNADSSAADAGKTDFFVDGDGDTYGAGAAIRFCDMPSGYSSVSTDCDDANATAFPGALEQCNGIDDNCDTVVDDNLVFQTYYADADGDGFGASGDAGVSSCSAIAGKVTNNTDCDDVRADVNPGATEVCDAANTDEDCDTLADNADSSAADAGKTNFFVDGDSDTYGAGTAARFCDMPSGYSAVSTDCDDVRADVNPGATEVCDAANTDEDCDTLADNADSSAADAGKTNFFVDGDSDTYGAGSAVRFCDMPSGYSAVSTDCDDVRADVNPGATEVCDAANTDEDCDTLADNADSSAADAGKTDFFVDGDSDTYGAGAAARFCDMPSGYSAVSTDCDDVRADVNPGATEVCDAANTDEDCDALADNADSSAADAGKTNFFLDGDSDTYGAGSAVRFCDMPSGYSAVSTDCDDVRADVNPGATEVCDAANTDEDCDTLADNADSSAADAGKTDFFVDGDSDTYGAGTAARFCDMPSGYSAVSTDCDDVRADVNPGATEVCDLANTDEDCDTLADNADSSAADAGKTDFFVDGDSDTYGAGSAVRFCDMPSGYSAVSTDCDDVRADVNPGATEVCDAANTDEDCDTLADNADSSAADAGKTNFFLDGDSDTYGAGSAVRFCDMPSGYSAVSTDCDDVRADVNPGATEVCDAANTDEDCDTLADNADSSAADAGKTNFFVDGDSDTYGAGAAVRFCDMPSGYSLVSTDCDDVRADVNPGAIEVCDLANTDEDCDTLADDADASATGKSTFYRDADSDGFTGATTGLFCDMPAGYEAANENDCDDANPSAYPGAVETCADLSVDNDCDGSVAEDESVDAVIFYADTDNDGAGDPNVTVLACNAPAGYVAVAGDLCPNTPARTAPVTWYGDADNDGVGDSAVTTSACDQPAGYVATAGDTCPADGNKTEPGACGCGTPDTDGDADGNPDCFGQIAALTLAADLSVYAPGEQIVVRVAKGASGTGIRSAALVVAFDASRLELASASTVAGSEYSVEVSEVIDNIGGSLRYTVALPTGVADSATPAALADLVFNVRAGATFCNAGGLVTFGSVGGVSTRLTTASSAQMIPIVSPLDPISLLSLPPTIDGVPADYASAADAGTVDGALVAEPTVTASDFCGGVASVAVAITYPDASTANAWPATGMFPVGVSTILWTATDEVGQTSTATSTVTIENYQLLDVDASLIGSIAGSTTRTIRVKVGASTSLFEVPFVAGLGAIDGVQVPVTASIPCLLVKDTEHSVSASAAASVNRGRYQAILSLKQGDSNNDDVIDILDFGIFFGDYGVDATARAISNFNADGFINNADFAFIGVNYLSVGDGCTGADAPRQPVTRISVKELRRRGMGELVAADINRDGWLDLRDMRQYMQHGHPTAGLAE